METCGCRNNGAIKPANQQRVGRRGRAGSARIRTKTQRKGRGPDRVPWSAARDFVSGGGDKGGRGGLVGRMLNT